MGYLGPRVAEGKLTKVNKIIPGTNLWVVEFTPEILSVSAGFEVYHGAARGPGGYFLVYIDESFYDVGESGFINAYEPRSPMFVRQGQYIRFHWSIANTPAPTITLWLREPEVGKL